MVTLTFLAGVSKERALRLHGDRHGEAPENIATARRHRRSGFSLRTYGHLFETMPIATAEWWDDLLWPAGCPYAPVPAAEMTGRTGGRGPSSEAGGGTTGKGPVSIDAELQDDGQETAPRAASKGVRASHLP